jgi:hypothetical protein
MAVEHIRHPVQGPPDGTGTLSGNYRQSQLAVYGQIARRSLALGALAARLLVGA